LLSLLTERIDAEALRAGPRLRGVANMAVGYNNIDVPACRARGVVVTNTPDVLTNACADFTWALILAVTRRLGEGGRPRRRLGQGVTIRRSSSTTSGLASVETSPASCPLEIAASTRRMICAAAP